MIKHLFFILFISSMGNSIAQSYYFETNKTHCEFANREAKQHFETAVLGLQYKKYWPQSTEIFLNLIQKDSTFCDGYFFAGYTLRLQERFRDATAMYYVADSLSPHPILEYKLNLATTASYAGATELGRSKYEEIVEYFPSDPEGYYGIVATSMEVGDFENGLNNINTALTKYNARSIKFGEEVYLVKGNLLVNLDRLSQAIVIFDKVKGKLKRDDFYLVPYAYALKKVGETKNDASMIKRAKKLYSRVQDTSNVGAHIKAEFSK